jgi:hypothetical protein
MDENDADNMALQVRCEALDNLAQRWTDFVQSCLEAAARDDTISEDAEANVPGLLRETEFLHRETRMALNRVREHEMNLMKITVENPGRSLQVRKACHGETFDFQCLILETARSAAQEEQGTKDFGGN